MSLGTNTSIKEELRRIHTAKEAIRSAINSKGGSIDPGTSIGKYASEILKLSGGSGDSFAKVTEFIAPHDAYSAEHPTQPLVLNAVSVTFENGEWTTGPSVTLTEYEKEPIPGGIYCRHEGKLYGDVVAFDFEKYMPTAGLLCYFPMTGKAVRPADYVNHTELAVIGNGTCSGEDGWYGTGGSGGLWGVLVRFKCPEIFTLSFKFKVDETSGDHPLFEISDGFGIWVSSNYRMDFSVGGSTIYNEKYLEQYDGKESREHHVVLCCYGDYARIFIDSALVSDTDNHISCGTPKENAARIYCLGNEKTFVGKISEVLLYNRALSEGEVVELTKHYALDIPMCLCSPGHDTLYDAKSNYCDGYVYSDSKGSDAAWARMTSISAFGLSIPDFDVFPAWIQADTPMLCAPTRIEMEAYNWSTMVFQGSRNGTQWTDIAAFTNPGDGWQTFEVHASAEYSSFRFYFPSSLDGGKLTVKKLYFYRGGES